MPSHEAGPFDSAPYRGPRLIAFPNAATAAFLDRPTLLHGQSAREVLEQVAGHARERRLSIETALTRLEDLRERLIAKLDALDPDPDLEPVLSCLEAMDQRKWWKGANDDRECGDDDEPSLGAIAAMNQRFWSYGGSHDYEAEHDGREPDPVESCDWPDDGDQTRFRAQPELV